MLFTLSSLNPLDLSWLPIPTACTLASATRSATLGAARRLHLGPQPVRSLAELVGIDPNVFYPISPDVNGIECDGQHSRAATSVRSSAVPESDGQEDGKREPKNNNARPGFNPRGGRSEQTSRYFCAVMRPTRNSTNPFSSDCTQTFAFGCPSTGLVIPLSSTSIRTGFTGHSSGFTA
jgi:hypothetical protein